MKSFEKFTTIMMYLAVAFFLTFYISKFARSSDSHAARALIGQTIALPGVHFSSQHDSVVLGISTSCPYCNASAPFYRQLTDRFRGRVDVYAVLPESPAKATQYLSGEGLSVHEVSAQLNSIGVDSTPTLLIVDGHGTVKDAWVGMQDQVGQQKILATLQQ